MTSLLTFGLQAAIAESMRCGTDMIETGEREPLFRAEVISKCGSADSESGDSLIYKQGASVYVLRFDSDDKLVSITQKSQD
jgi:hypothetical protein